MLTEKNTSFFLLDFITTILPHLLQLFIIKMSSTLYYTIPFQVYILHYIQCAQTPYYFVTAIFWDRTRVQYFKCFRRGFCVWVV